MKIQCPNCHKITELEHVDHGSQVECVCSFIFTVDESTITEEFTEIDSVLPDWIGQYKVTGFIGFGGMGKVYLAEHPTLGIPVAIKALRMEYMTDQAACERFVQSAKICARINHPNIVRIYDCGYENGNVYLVMEYITNGSAQTLLDEHGKLDPEYAAFVMLEVCSGLMEAEKYGIIHRDIKPENIMFDSEGTVKILDLGLSKIRGDRRISQQSMTASLTALGTPLYMAPEQAVDAANCDSRADIYSIGVSLYQLCTGKMPFDSDDPHELRRMHAMDKPVPPHVQEPNLLPDLETIILRCMEKKREDRYASITDLALDLEAYLKNRVLPSKLRQEEEKKIVFDPVGQKPDPRRRHTMLRRSTTVLLHRYPQLKLLWLVPCAIVGFALFSVWFGSVRHADSAVSRDVPLTAEKLLSALATRAVHYLQDQDYEYIIGMYRNYNGPLAEETRSERLRLAAGYQLSQRHLASDLRLLLAELLLDGRSKDAIAEYHRRSGSRFCPECLALLNELADVPMRFHDYWKARRGQTVILNVPGSGRMTFRVADSDMTRVYVIPVNGGKPRHLAMTELPLELQLEILGDSDILRRFWTGKHEFEQGNLPATLEKLKTVPGYGMAFVRILTPSGQPESGRGSARSR